LKDQKLDGRIAIRWNLGCDEREWMEPAEDAISRVKP
jgi:hypothetical protein